MGENGGCDYDFILDNCCATCKTLSLYEEENSKTTLQDTFKAHATSIACTSVGLLMFILGFVFCRHCIRSRRVKKRTSEVMITLCKAPELIYYDWCELIKEVPAGGEERIVQGKFGVVIKARNVDGRAFAIKMLSRSPTEEQKDHLEVELRLASMIDPHPNVVSIFAWTRNPENQQIGIIMPFYELGSLESHLYGCRKGSREIWKSTSDKLHLIKDLASGLQHLHVSGIIHRDIAARNLLLYKGLYHFRLVICDFGMAICNEEVKQKFSKVRGPIKWMAPESLIRGHFSKKSDVFSFGMTCYEIIDERPPWENLTWIDAMKRTKKGLYPPWREKSNGTWGRHTNGYSLSHNLGIPHTMKTDTHRDSRPFGSYRGERTHSSSKSGRVAGSQRACSTLLMKPPITAGMYSGLGSLTDEYTIASQQTGFGTQHTGNTSRQTGCMVDRDNHLDQVVLTMCKDMVTKCWEKDPKLRPDISEVCSEINTIFEFALCTSADDTYAIVDIEVTGEYNEIEFSESSIGQGREEKPDDV